MKEKKIGLASLYAICLTIAFVFYYDGFILPIVNESYAIEAVSFKTMIVLVIVVWPSVILALYKSVKETKI